MRRPLRTGLTGVVATLVMLGAAELIARGFGVDAAPLLTLGQAIIPLTPAGLIKPAIDLLGTNDKPVLVLTTGLGALIIGGIIGGLSCARPRLATLALLLTGAVPLLVILTRPGTGILDLVPTVVGLGLGIGVFTILLPVALGASTDGPSGEDPSVAEEQPTRRRFLRLATVIGMVGAAAVAAGQTVAALSADASAAIARLVLPPPATAAPSIPAAAGLTVPGLAPFLTDPEDFYRIDTLLAPPQIDPQQWTLRIHGMVETEVTLSMQDLLALPLVEAHITLTCVSNPVGGNLVGNATWLGYPVRELLRRAQPRPEADMVLSHSFDGFTASTPLEALLDGRDSLLAVGMNGRPLPPEHGFPARLVVPGLYGFVSATKWVTELEVTRFDRSTAYWTDRGWDAKAPILVASRVDVPKPLARVPSGDVVVAGTAWAQRRGIERVEVRLDDGDWTRAELADEVTIDTWRQWRADFRGVKPGSHAVTVRAYDRDGNVQTSRRRDSIPNSATGHHHIQFRAE